MIVNEEDVEWISFFAVLMSDFSLIRKSLNDGPYKSKGSQDRDDLTRTNSLLTIG